MIDAVVLRQPTDPGRGGRSDAASAGGPLAGPLRVVATVPFLIGAVSILAEQGGGLYWMVAGIVLAIAASVANAWVLLVEILR